MVADRKAILRVEVESGETYDDPSEDYLFLLFEDIENGAGSWLIVEKLEDSSGQTYAQCFREDDGSYHLEHRLGGPDEHWMTAVETYREAHEFLTAWAFDLPGWRDLPWARLTI